jgi:hypothetical protein
MLFVRGLQACACALLCTTIDTGSTHHQTQQSQAWQERACSSDTCTLASSGGNG